jgi:molybdopterin-guanine dinucleotide biosynthesis protein A
MLMVGAVDRNAGKTKFVGSLIKKFSSRYDITGIKVTAVDEANGSCPRGGQGCGVCSSLNSYYYIAEETESESDKDTCRMLASGASRVFWLRVLKAHLTKGASALLDIIGDGAVSICESNSLRQVVEPGVFMMVKGCGGGKYKASAECIAEYVDRFVFFDGNEFDIDAGEVEIVGGKWACKLKATAIILAGGKSTRMGQDKSMLPISSQPMIEYICNQLRPNFKQILISTNADDVSKYAFLGVDAVVDKVAGMGPLMGISSALEASANEVNFVIGCDIPEVDMDFVREMCRQARRFEAVVPRIGPNQYEPLFGVYRKSILDSINKTLGAGKRRVVEAFEGCRVKYIDIDGKERLRNLNTRCDYQEFAGRKNNAGF